MEINPSEVASKKVIGKLNGSSVFAVGLKGGLHLVIHNSGGKATILGVGPHVAVAKHLSKKREPRIEWTELNKADHIEPEHFAFCIPEYEALTEAFRRAQGL